MACSCISKSKDSNRNYSKPTQEDCKNCGAPLDLMINKCNYCSSPLNHKSDNFNDLYENISVGEVTFPNHILEALKVNYTSDGGAR